MGRLWQTIVGGAIFSAACWGVLHLARAEEPAFRVDNRVFFNDAKTPASEGTTIFCDGAIYDFLDQPAETFVFDASRQRFVLLNTTRRVSAQITTQKVLDFTAQLRQSMESRKGANGNVDPFLQFLARPNFEQHAQGEQLTFESPWVTYRVSATPAPDGRVAVRYREFSDWFAQLSPVLAPSGKPPFARMAIDAALADKNLVPRQVEVTITPKKGLWPQRIAYRSEHVWHDRLTTADQQRVNQARQFIMTFHAVSFEQYSKNLN